MQGRRALGIFGLLLAALVAQLGWGAATDGVTIDELVYIHAGYRHLCDNDFRLNPEQPPLAKQWAALGLAGMELRIDPPEKGAGDEWTSAYRFIHVDNAARPVVGRARAAAIVLTILLVVVVAAWALEAVGGRAARIAAALLVFHPSILAHGHLVTTDAPAALMMVLASWLFWRWCQQPTAARAGAVGLALGLGLATRITTVLLVPIFVVLVLWEARRPGNRLNAKSVLLAAAALAILAPAIVWGAYGFRFEPWPDASVARPVAPSLGFPGRLVAFAERHRLLPEAYLEGARFILEHNATGHPTYLLGKVSTEGWPQYYLVALGVKSPLAFLLLCSIGIGVSFLGRSPPRVWLHWALPMLTLLGAMSLGRIQIGERYVLAVYPYLALLAAAGLAAVLDRRLGRRAVFGLLAAQAVTALLSAGSGYLTFFNAFAGGPAFGHRVLVDSNLDWGQDLPRLADWMRGEAVSRISLAYHGCDDPDRHRIVRDDLPGVHLYPEAKPTRELRGTVAISPNLLVGVFDPPGNPRYRALQSRVPDARAGALFIYRLGEPGLGPLPY